MNIEIREMYLIHDLLLESKEEAIKVSDGKPENVNKVFVGCSPKDMNLKELSTYDYLGFIYSDREKLEREIKFERGL